MNPDANPSGARRAMLGAALLMAVLIAGRAVRDALFLAEFAVSELPLMMVAAAALSMLMAALASFVLARIAPAVAIPVALAGSAVLFGAEWLWLQADPRPASVAIYLHIHALATVAISGFWTVVNERFDPYTAKTVVARAGGYGALGGVLGGLAVLLLAPRIGIASMLFAFAALHAAAAATVYALGRPAPASRGAASPGADRAASASGLGQLFRSPFVMRMALLAGLIAVTDELVAFAFKAAAAASHPDPDGLVRFFALFYTGANVLAFGLQTGLGSRALRVLGLGGTIALAPAVIAATAGVAGVVGGLAATTAVRAANAAFGFSFFRAGFELLWTPIPTRLKRTTKSYVDVGAKSIGEMSGSAAVLLLVAVTTHATTAVLALAVLTCLLSLFVIASLHRRYVRQLADNLRSGAVSVSDEEVVDATTSRTLAESKVTIDRAELDARLRQLDRETEARARAEGRDDLAEAPTGPGENEIEAVLERISALGGGDLQARLEALADPDPRLVPFVLPLLEDPESRTAAVGWLAAVAPRATGQLEDALLDAGEPALVRRSVPEALAASQSRRGLEALLRGLDEDAFDLRLACGRAALLLTDARRDLRLAARDVVPRVAKELEIPDRLWEQQGRRRHLLRETTPLLDASLVGRVDRSVEHVFDLLGLARGREEMTSTLQALYSEDRHLRGTALEFVHAILPERLRSLLWRRIPGGAPTRISDRSAESIVGELLAAQARRAPGER